MANKKSMKQNSKIISPKAKFAKLNNFVQEQVTNKENMNIL